MALDVVQVNKGNLPVTVCNAQTDEGLPTVLWIHPEKPVPTVAKVINGSLPVTVKDVQSDQPDERLLTESLIRNSIAVALLVALGIAITVGTVCAIVYTHDELMNRPKYYPTKPYRVVVHDIWVNHVLEFFHEKVKYNDAVETCSRRGAILLHFPPKKSKDDIEETPESKFDAYVNTHFWLESDYPDIKYWTGNFWLIHKDSGIITSQRIIGDYPVVFPGGPARCRKIGEGQKNALLKTTIWQEKHMIKDYVPSHQHGYDKEKHDKEQDERNSTWVKKDGCWNIINREDLTPEHEYYFVCQRKLTRKS